MAKLNEGGNGFHLFTVVTDGYGNLITEDCDGKEIARGLSSEDEAQTQSAFLALMQTTWHKLNDE